MDNDQLYDVTIIGGGPAGLFSAFYSGLREMKTKIIEYQPQLGGKVHVYPEKIIWDVGGLTPTPGAKLIEQLVRQGLTFEPEVVLGEKVTAIRKTAVDQFEVHTASGHIHYSRTVIVAVGSGILNPQRIDIEGAQRFEVTNLHYTVKTLRQFKDKTIIISGGGNTAVDWANELEPIARKIYLIYRKDELKGHEAQVTQLKNSSVELILNAQISKFIAETNHDRIEKVELTCTDTGEVVYLPVDEVIINHGYELDSSLLKNSSLNIEMKDDFYVAGNSNSQSSVPGLYAAGDILHHEAKVHLIAGAFQDAANAVNQAKLYIQPNATKTVMVSSHNDLFKERNREIVKQLM